MMAGQRPTKATGVAVPSKQPTASVQVCNHGWAVHRPEGTYCQICKMKLYSGSVDLSDGEELEHWLHLWSDSDWCEIEKAVAANRSTIVADRYVSAGHVALVGKRVQDLARRLSAPMESLLESTRKGAAGWPDYHDCAGEGSHATARGLFKRGLLRPLGSQPSEEWRGTPLGRMVLRQLRSPHPRPKNKKSEQKRRRKARKKNRK